MGIMQQCTVGAEAKGVAVACVPCTRRVICLAERRVERRAARTSRGFLEEVKAKLAANEERADQKRAQE
ncbi:hypothetical protein ACFLXE_03810 [Chloroflexota bacterium]